MSGLRLSALVGTCLTYALIILGGWVRTTNSGLSCPDWPTCYGEWWLTPADFAALGDVGYTYFQVMLEWGHRLVAGVFLGPLLLLLAFLAWPRGGTDRGLGLAILALVLVQGLLGGLTVLDRNSPWSVALHLGTALVILALLVLVFERRQPAPAAPMPRPVVWLALATWAAAFAAMVTAAMTAKSGASLACYAWPSCDGAWLPDLGDPMVRIHFLHRSAAALTGLGILALLGLARATPLAAKVRTSLLLVIGQIGLGALVIRLEVPLWSAVAHQALGVLLFALLSALMWQAWRTPAAVTPSHPLEGDARVGLGRA